MNPQQAGDSGVPNIEQLQNVAMNVVENFCGIVAMPVEIIIRPHYGTRYYPVPVTFFACVMMIILPLFSAMATGIVNMIPFSHARAPIGLFSIGSLSQVFFLLLFIHGIRLYRRMIDMSREQNSEFEGPPLPFFQLIPGTGSFWRTRILIEPAVVFITGTVLGRFYIFQSGLATYVQIAALMLTMKSFVAYGFGNGNICEKSWTRVLQARSSPSWWRTVPPRKIWLQCIWRASPRTLPLICGKPQSRISPAPSPAAMPRIRRKRTNAATRRRIP